MVTECERKIAEDEGVAVESLKTIDDQIAKAKSTLEKRAANAQKRAKSQESISPEALAHEKEVKRLENLNLKVAKKTQEFQNKLTPEDERNFYTMHQELNKTSDADLKAKFQNGIDKIVEKAQPDNLENQTKNATLKWGKSVVDNLKGFVFSNFLTPGSIVKKTLTDMTQLIMTPSMYYLHGDTEAAKAFTQQALKSLFGGEEGIKNSHAVQSFLQTLATGDSTHFKEGDFLKSNYATGEISKNPLRLTGIIPRALSAISEGFYQTNLDAQSKGIAADRLARADSMRKAGKTQEEIDKATGTEATRQALGDHLYGAPDAWNKAAATVKASSDALEKTTGQGLSDREQQLATWNKMRDLLPDDVKEKTETFALKQTLLNHPTGMLGKLYDVANAFRNIKVEGTNATPLNYEFPFIKVGFNLLNNSLEFTPLGIARSFAETEYAGTKGGQEVRYEKDYLDRTQQLMRGVIGTTLMAGLFSLAYKNRDDPNAWFQIHGEGSSNWQKRAQDTAEGKIPLSMQFGTKFVSFKDSILGTPLSIVGNLIDYMKNPKTDPENIPGIIGTAAALTLGQVTNLSVFKTLGDISDAVKGATNGDTGQASKKIEDILLNTAKGLIPFHGTLQYFDHSPIDRFQGIWPSIISGTPFIENIGNNKPALNYFGEPIQKNLSDRLGAFGIIGFGSSSMDAANISPEWKFLGQKGYTLPTDQYVNISILSKEKAGENPAFEQKRAQNLGSQYANILTSQERYDLIKTAGPKIKAVIAQYAQRYGNSGFNPDVQKAITFQVSKIFTDTKKDMFIK